MTQYGWGGKKAFYCAGVAFAVCGVGISSGVFHSEGTKTEPRIKTRKRQTTQTTHNAGKGLEDVILITKQIIPIPKNNNTKAVAVWSVARRITKTAIATIIQNTGELGNTTFPILKFTSPGICRIIHLLKGGVNQNRKDKKKRKKRIGN